ncbi:MAG: hypothetical protein MJ108_08965 [Saccharofermentans sp.]|nr:hypothetical protein [Saccharofermentans sp.]
MKYVKPEAEIINIENEDIVVASIGCPAVNSYKGNGCGNSNGWVGVDNISSGCFLGMWATTCTRTGNGRMFCVSNRAGDNSTTCTNISGYN